MVLEDSWVDTLIVTLKTFSFSPWTQTGSVGSDNTELRSGTALVSIKLTTLLQEVRNRSKPRQSKAL